MESISLRDEKKLTGAQLAQLCDKMQKDMMKCIGYYSYEDFRIRIMNRAKTAMERYMKLRSKRKAEGVCVVCAAKVTKINPVTGKKYSKCETHRERENELRRTKRVKGKKVVATSSSKNTSKKVVKKKK